MTEQAPKWFTDAISTPSTEHRLGVDGTDIHYLRWGNRLTLALCLSMVAELMPTGGVFWHQCCRVDTASLHWT